MNKIFTAILILFVSSVVWAVGEPVPNVFSNGTPADANAVNENFQELADRIVEIPVGPQGPIGLQGEPGPAGPQGEPGPPGTALQTYNYLDYSHNFSSKTFDVLSDGVLVRTETRTYDRSTPDTLLVHSHVITNSTPAYEYFDTLIYNLNEDGISVVKSLAFDAFDVDNPAANEPIAIYENNPPVLVRKTSMMMGVSWGFFTTVRTEELTQPTTIQENYSSLTYVLLGIESVAVRDVTYDNCLRIHSSSGVRNSYPSSAVRWYCSGYGLVKTVASSGPRGDGTVTLTISELVSTAP